MPTQVDAIASAGALIAGKYRIEAPLGRGGMGAVYAARHVLTGRRFAIKLLSRELTGNEGAEERFMREALLASSIQHPAIVEVYDVGRDRGVPYMVMKLLQGETLGQRLERGPLSVEQTVALMLPVIDAIAAAHAHGIVHRDLKPDNVLIEREGDREYPRVLDFGIGKLLDGDARGPAITRPGMIIGTPEYMAPEQVRGEADLDARCDVYALGVLLFELLTGTLPHSDSDMGTLLRAIAYHPPPTLRSRRPDLPEPLEAVVTHAMSPDRAHRYPNAAALYQALTAVASPNANDSLAGPSLVEATTELALEMAARRSLAPGGRVVVGVGIGLIAVAVAVALVAIGGREPVVRTAAAAVPAEPVVMPVPVLTPRPVAKLSSVVTPPAPAATTPVTRAQERPARARPARPRKEVKPQQAVDMPSLTSEILDPFQ